MTEPTIAVRLLGPLLDTCVKQGGASDATALRMRLGLDRIDLDDPESRISLSRFYDLLEHAADLAKDELFGMHYSLNVDPASFDVLGFLTMTSPTLGVAFERVFRYQDLLYEGEFGELIREGPRATITICNWGPSRRAHQMWVEAGLVDIVVNGRRLVRSDFDVHELRCRHRAPSPASTARLQELLRAPIRYGAEDNALVMSSAILDLPIPTADAAMFAFFEREAARRAATHVSPTATILDELAPLIDASLPEGIPELGQLAARHHLSARTLQRRLAEHGTSLRKLIDERRHELALRHLCAGLSIAEVSFLLGFSEPSAFHRAFKRWTGHTPKQWRQLRQPNASEAHSTPR